MRRVLVSLLIVGALVAAMTVLGTGPVSLRADSGPASAVAAPAVADAKASATRAGAAARDGRPNIIVITTDDQNLSSLSPRTMPNVVRLLEGPGTSFSDYVVSGPLCCPARAVFLSGQYGHNNGVTWNKPGGYADLRNKGNTLPVWLREAGYRTAHVGRYLNLYERFVADPNEVAPGWQEWHTTLEPRGYFNYTLRRNGGSVRFGSQNSDYLTRVLNRTAVGLIRRQAPRRKPLFMSIDQFAPHGAPSNDSRCSGTVVPDPADRDRFLNKKLPRTPSFNEADVSDKPSFVADRPRLGPAEIAETTRKHRCRLASLRAVDRGVGQVVRVLRREGELRNTVIMFTSDNGWFEGQHRIPDDKLQPYEENIRVPLIVRAPSRVLGSRAPGRIGRPVANIDLAPTILRLAGAEPCTGTGRCRVLDGRSFVGLLRGKRNRWPSDRGVLLELDVPEQRAARFLPCDYEGIRAEGHVYLEHHSSTGGIQGRCIPREERELYDLRQDPFQLENLSPTPPASADGRREARLAARLARLERCAGVAGRDPRQGTRAFCE